MQQIDPNFSISDDALLHIFSWLDPKALAQSSAACRRWRLLGKSNSLWRPHTHRDLPHFPLNENTTPYEHYCLNGRGLRLKKLHIANELIYSAWGKTLCIWQKKSEFPVQYSCFRTQTDHTAAIESFAVRQIGLLSLMVTGSADHSIKVWKRNIQRNTYTLLQTMTLHESPVISIQGIHDFLFCGSADGDLSIWRYSIRSAKYEPAQSKIKAHRCGMRMLLAAPHPRYLFTVGENRTLKIWSLGKKLRWKQTLNDFFPRIKTIFYDYLRDQLLCSTFEGQLYQLNKDLSSRFYLKTITIVSKAIVHEITICQKIKKIITLENGHIVRIWNTMEGSWTQEKEIDLADSAQAMGIIAIPDETHEAISKIYYIQNNHLKILDLQNRHTRCKQFTITAAEIHEARPIKTKLKIIPMTCGSR